MSKACQGHVLLANQIGFQLQKYAIEHIQNKYPPGATRNNQGPEMDIVHHLVQASIANADSRQPLPPHTQEGSILHPITWAAAQALATKALQTFATDEAPIKLPTTEEVLYQLRHTGVIRHMRPRPHFLRLHLTGPLKPKEHCAIPIPAITQYMLAQFQELPEHQKNRIDSSHFRRVLLASLWPADVAPPDDELQRLLDRVQQLIP